MKRSRIDKSITPPSVRTAALYALNITLMIYLLFVVMFFYGRSAVIPYEDPHPPRMPFNFYFLLFGFATTYLYIFILFCVNFSVLKMNRYDNTVRTTIAILATLLIALLWSNIILWTQRLIFDLPGPGPRALRGEFMRDFVLGGLVVFSSQIIVLNHKRQQMAFENQVLKAEYEKARYEALKSQVDPHFLFNTLNTLNSIVKTDPDNAQEYIQKLSAVFRYTMQNRQSTTLAEELEFTRDYCALMQIRYGENLNFEFDISAKYNAYCVVPFSVQTLVENAIKHNVISNRQPLTVTIHTDPDDTITVSNRINAKTEPEAGKGIGLANLAERYRLMWERDITIRQTDGVFSVRIPLIAEHNAIGKQ